MAQTAQALRELHRIHRQLADLKSRLERGPKQIRASETALASLEQEFGAAKETVMRAQVNSNQKELQLRQREGRIDDMRLRLNSCSTNREYQAIQEQIAADEQANSVLSDEIVELLEKIDELKAGAAAAQQRVELGRQELDRVRQKVNQERSALETDLGRLTAELHEAESRLPGEVKADYSRVVKSRGEETLAAVESGYCQGCNQQITSQMMNELKLEKPVYCKSCGRLLYLPEDRRVGRSDAESK